MLCVYLCVISKFSCGRGVRRDHQVLCLRMDGRVHFVLVVRVGGMDHHALCIVHEVKGLMVGHRVLCLMGGW